MPDANTLETYIMGLAKVKWQCQKARHILGPEPNLVLIYRLEI